MKLPIVAVLAGGTSAEREVSLGSGRAVAIAAARSFPTRLFETCTDELPAELDPRRHVVLSALHGTFGEDGGMQALLAQAGVEFAGSDAESSALTIDKTRTKQVIAECGMRIADSLTFEAHEKPAVGPAFAKVGPRLILKPNDQGSSVGLHLIDSERDLVDAFSKATTGTWLLEKRIIGRELSVGVLRGRALGVVEIRPKSGVYSYESKYTKGLTEYFAPAPLEGHVTLAVQAAAESAFRACGCRDYARVDFILDAKNDLYFLEINTLPGMKETSLLPMSARCAGLDFTALVREMVGPALERFHPVPATAIP